MEEGEEFDRILLLFCAELLRFICGRCRNTKRDLPSQIPFDPLRIPSVLCFLCVLVGKKRVDDSKQNIALLLGKLPRP